jgi:lipopolysaccharide assembly outer membrane protein LptD (OstA)
VNVPWRRIILVAALAFAAWVTWGIVHAGGPVLNVGTTAVSELERGHAEGRRVNAKAWSLDYSKIIEAPDGSTATLYDVRHGEIFRAGKPYVSVRADSVVVNTISNDFSANGHVVLTENDGKHKRLFRSERALYNGIPQILTLPSAVHIESDGMTASFDHAIVNLKTGSMQLGRIDAIG